MCTVSAVIVNQYQYAHYTLYTYTVQYKSTTTVQVGDLRWLQLLAGVEGNLLTSGVWTAIQRWLCPCSEDLEALKLCILYISKDTEHQELTNNIEKSHYVLIVGFILVLFILLIRVRRYNQ